MDERTRSFRLIYFVCFAIFSYVSEVEGGYEMEWNGRGIFLRIFSNLPNGHLDGRSRTSDMQVH